MFANPQFALMQNRTDDYVVMNVVVASNYESANQAARDLYGQDAIAVETTRYYVGKGYTYHDGNFYDLDGNYVPQIPTEEEEIERLNAKVNQQAALIQNLQTTISNQDEILADILLNN